MKNLHKITFLLLIVGGLNWLLLGVFGWEIGSLFGGSSAMLSRLIYVLVGLSAIAELVGHKKCCTDCGGKGGCPRCGKKDCVCGKQNSGMGGQHNNQSGGGMQM